MPTAASQVKVGRPTLWFGVLGGAIAWTLHLMLAYATAEFGCIGRLGDQSYLGISTVAWLELALTVAMASASSAATAVAYRSHRRLHSNAETAGPDEKPIALAGLLMSGLFTLIILFESIPILFYLRAC